MDRRGFLTALIGVAGGAVALGITAKSAAAAELLKMPVAGDAINTAAVEADMPEAFAENVQYWGPRRRYMRPRRFYGPRFVRPRRRRCWRNRWGRLVCAY